MSSLGYVFALIGLAGFMIALGALDWFMGERR